MRLMDSLSTPFPCSMPALDVFTQTPCALLQLASMRLEELQGLIAQGRACTVELQDSGLLAGNLCWDEAESAVCGILHSDISLGLS